MRCQNGRIEHEIPREIQDRSFQGQCVVSSSSRQTMHVFPWRGVTNVSITNNLFLKSVGNYSSKIRTQRKSITRYFGSELFS